MPEDNPYAAPVVDVKPPPTGSNYPGPHNYASLGERFLGALVDLLVLIAIGAVVFLVTIPIFISETVAESDFFEKLEDLDMIAGLVIGLVMTVGYMAVQWAFWSSSSQSIGKRVMKTQIVNFDGTRASITTIAFKRYLVMSLLGLIPTRIGDWIGIVDVLMIFRKDRNCLHDDIAKTRVIKLPLSQ